jgi:aspartate racemase
LIYRHLAGYLGPDQPMYGLQPHGLEGDQPCPPRIEDMASCYLNEIRAIQPEGPYYLAGLSMGGQVAFEMAQQLHERGQGVALLALFDTYCSPAEQDFPSTTTWAFIRAVRCGTQGLFQKIQYHWSALGLPNPGEKVAYVQRKARQLIRMLFPMGRSFDARAALALSDARQRLEAALHQAACDYMPKPYPGRATLFRARVQPPESRFCRDRTLGWSGLVTGGLEFIDTLGAHTTMFEEPFVRSLAANLKVRLDAAQGSETRSRTR